MKALIHLLNEPFPRLRITRHIDNKLIVNDIVESCGKKTV